MRKLHLFAALAVLALSAATAQGQQVQQDGNKPKNGVVSVTPGGGYQTDTTVTRQIMSSAGSAAQYDDSRDRDNWAILNGGQPLFNDTLTVGSGVDFGGSASVTAGLFYTAESTATGIAAGSFTHFTLFWRVIPAQGDTTTKIKLAWQIRGQLTAGSDSIGTFAWTPGDWDATLAHTTVFDEVDSTLSKTTSTIATVPLPTEFVTYFSPKWYAVMPSAYQAFSFPSGRMKPLVDRQGVWFWAPYISVRVRCLTGAAKPRVIAYLAGRP